MTSGFKGLKKFVLMVAACMLTLCLPVSAFAGTATSPSLSKTISGNGYIAQVTCTTSSGFGQVYGKITCTTGSVYAGWMGGETILYSGSGVVVKDIYGYNQTYTSIFSQQGGDTNYSNYYGWMKPQAWNSSTSSYENLGTTKTATISAYSSISSASCNVNSLGLTYGSFLSLSDDCSVLPDLVLVEGINGTEGYVYASEWKAYQPSNPQDATRLAEQEFTLIPVYDCEGVTQIDEFKIEHVSAQN